MRFFDLAPQIQTGDVLVVDGDHIGSNLIEFGTGGRFSHIAIFFRPTEDMAKVMRIPYIPGRLYVAEMFNDEEGFCFHPADQMLTKGQGKLYFGVAPSIVRINPEKVLAKLAEFVGSMPEYGYTTLPLVEAAHLFHVRIDAERVLPVCSTLVQMCWEECGVVFNQSLADPSDYDEMVAGVVEIDQ